MIDIIAALLESMPIALLGHHKLSLRRPWPVTGWPYKGWVRWTSDSWSWRLQPTAHCLAPRHICRLLLVLWCCGAVDHRVTTSPLTARHQLHSSYFLTWQTGCFHSVHLPSSVLLDEILGKYQMDIKTNTNSVWPEPSVHNYSTYPMLLHKCSKNVVFSN